MSKYLASYTCRLCGTMVDYPAPANMDVNVVKAFMTTDAQARKRPPKDLGVEPEMLHRCPDGSLGVMDFNGFITV